MSGFNELAPSEGTESLDVKELRKGSQGFNELAPSEGTESCAITSWCAIAILMGFNELAPSEGTERPIFEGWLYLFGRFNELAPSEGTERSVQRPGRVSVVQVSTSLPHLRGLKENLGTRSHANLYNSVKRL